MAAHATGAELEKICRLYRSVQAAENADPSGDDERRYVQTRATDDGMGRITALGSPDEAARITKAIDTAAQRVSAETGGRGQPSLAPTASPTSPKLTCAAITQAASPSRYSSPHRAPPSRRNLAAPASKPSSPAP